MRILFVQPSGETLRGLPAPPYAVMYVAAVAETLGHKVKIIDRNLETNTRKKILDFQPQMLCVTSLTGPMLLDALRVARFTHQAFPDIPIVWGGIHVSLLPKESLEHPLVDFVVIKEGEVTFKEFLQVYAAKGSFATVPGLGFKRDGQPVINKPRELIANLDTLPLAPWHLVEAKKYMKYETLFLTSRGCPHRCSFCYCEQYFNHTWRGMSAEHVKLEMDRATSYHPIKRYRFDDDNFTINRQRMYEILELVPKNASLYFETRLDYIDEPFCQAVSQFRDAFLFIGIESGNAAMLKQHKKDISLDQIRRAFALLHKYKINTTASFVIGAPNETQKQVEQTMKLAKELSPTRYTFCIFSPYPGSPYFNEIVRANAGKVPRGLEAWGRYSSLESTLLNYSQLSSKYLNRIYRKYWNKTILSFIRQFRWQWILIGLENMILIRTRLLMRKINGDI